MSCALRQEVAEGVVVGDITTKANGVGGSERDLDVVVVNGAAGKWCCLCPVAVKWLTPPAIASAPAVSRVAW